MATVPSDRIYTPDDLRRMPDGERSELVDGQLVEGDMSGLACWVASWVIGQLIAHVKVHGGGAVLTSDTQ